MFTKIGIACDESAEAARALKAAIGLASALKAQLHVITVAEGPPAYTAYGLVGDSSILQTIGEDRLTLYADLHKKVREMAAAEEVAVLTHLLAGDKVDTIVRCVREHKIDLLVMGLHHRSSRISRLWSTVYTLSQELSCSVLGVH